MAWDECKGLQCVPHAYGRLRVAVPVGARDRLGGRGKTQECLALPDIFIFQDHYFVLDMT